MTTAMCRSCRAQINYGPRHEGKTVKCPKCGQPVLLPEIQPPDGADEAAYAMAPAEPAPGPPSSASPELSNRDVTPAQVMPGRLRPERKPRSFWADARKSFTFLAEMDNAVVVVGYAVLMTVNSALSFLPGIIGLIISVFFYGMLFAFYFDIVRTTAGGEDDLPTLADWDGFIDSAIVPVIKFVGTIAVIMLPALISLIAFGFEPTPAKGIITGALMAAGWFYWPVVVLAVSTIGYGLVFRIDLILRTPFAAFGAYLSICALLIVALTFEWLGSSAVHFDPSGRMLDAMNIQPGSFVRWVVRMFEVFVINALGVSSSVISMRLIGLYYRHYSDRFPWSAG